ATFGRVEQLNPLEEQTIFPSTTLFRSPAKAVMVAKGQPPLPLQAQGRYEAMLAELHDVGVATVDLRPALAEKEAWLRTDTHWSRSEEHTSELQSRENLVCRLLLEKKKE